LLLLSPFLLACQLLGPREILPQMIQASNAHSHLQEWQAPYCSHAFAAVAATAAAAAAAVGSAQGVPLGVLEFHQGECQVLLLVPQQ
jgi:hypothetical protein